MNIFLSCGLIFLLGLGSSKLLGRLKFPAVTSYLLLGISIGPFGLKLIPENLVEATDFVGFFVLGIVAFTLGQNFLWREFRHIRGAVISISCLEVAGAAIFVTGGLLLINRPLSEAIIFGGIATATAPMATLMVIREYRARGSLTKMLMDIVAVDDAWGMIVFAVVVAAAKILMFHGTGSILNSALIGAGREILGAIAIGIISGILLSFLSKYSKTQMESLIFTLGFILVITGVSLKFAFSPLLSNMALGITVINITKRHLLFDVLRRVDWPFYLLFFVLCGASLQIPMLKSLTLVGIVYIAARTIGKYGGAYMGAKITHRPEKIKKYLGLGLIPQAGVALGLAIMAKAEFPTLGGLIFTTIVATTIFAEIIGPFCTKIAITRAGEAKGGTS